MTRLGPRFVTSPAERLAAEAVAQAFIDAGLSAVRDEPFTWDAWRPGSASLTVGADVHNAQPLSPAPATSLEATLASGDDFDGQIALLHSDDGGRPDSLTTALFGGARAFVRIIDFTDDDGTPLVEVGHTLEGSSLPGVVVDASTGDALEAAAGQVATLEIASETVTGHESVNVLGEVAGTGEGRVIVLAHYDSWHVSECAYDNALGVGAMLLLAEELASGPPPVRSVLFIATGAEEQGLQGANAWVAAHEAELDDVRLVLNLDVMWATEGTYRVAGTVGSHRLLAMTTAADLGIPDIIDAGEPGLGSDHLPFQTRGIDTFWTERWPYRHYHTTRDTHDRVDWDGAWRAYQVNRAVLWEAAGR